MQRNWLGVGLASLGLVACGTASCSTASSQGGFGASPESARGGSGSASDSIGGGSGSATGPAAPVGGPTVAGSSSAASSNSVAPPSPDGGPVDTGGGILTAGLWDDSLNYPTFTTYIASHGTIDGDPGFTPADYDAAHAAFSQRSPRTLVDVALVIDTTGSMGDELAYLTQEFGNITSMLSAQYPNAAPRWALVVYRDTPDSDPNDDYVVKSYDFTSNATAFAATVGAQTAANGGDYPESPELGIEQLGQLSWRADPSVAKVAFWVADAPHHVARAAAMKQAIVDTQTAGIHLYPVSASGTDALLELTMRSAAEISGGRYLFLTDDSGIGDPHKIPEIPCYAVTRLEKALVRGISMELTGMFLPPDNIDVMRVAGDPQPDGTCAFVDGGLNDSGAINSEAIDSGLDDGAFVDSTASNTDI